MALSIVPQGEGGTRANKRCNKKDEHATAGFMKLI